MRLEGMPIKADAIEYCKAMVAAGDKNRIAPPHIAIIQISEDNGSSRFCNQIQRVLTDIGGYYVSYYLNTSNNQTPFSDVLSNLKRRIAQINSDSSYTGAAIIMPGRNKSKFSHFQMEKLAYACQELKPELDLCGVRPTAIAKTLNPYINENYPVVARAAIMLLEYYYTPLDGRKVTILNKTMRFGIPLSNLLLQWGAVPVMLGTNVSPDVARTAMKNSDIIISGTDIPEIFNEKDIDYFSNTVLLDFGRGMLPNGYMESDFDLSMLDHNNLLSNITYANLNTHIDHVVVAAFAKQLIDAYDKKYQQERKVEWTLKAQIPENLLKKSRQWNHGFQR